MTGISIEERLCGKLTLPESTIIIASAVVSLQDRRILVCNNIDNPVPTVRAAVESWKAATSFVPGASQLMRINTIDKECYIYSDNEYLLLAFTSSKA